MSEKEKIQLPVNPNLVVKDFDPENFVQDYTNSKGEKMSRLPFNAQLMWFRLKFPEGKISVETRPGKNVIIAKARVYADRRDPVDAFIAEGESSRGPSPDMPSVNPRNWAQTAAIATALRYAGFGLECDLSGEEPEAISSEWDSLMENPDAVETKKTTTAKAAKAVIDNTVEDNAEGEGINEGAIAPAKPDTAPANSEIPDYANMSDDEAIQAASKVVFKNGKFEGKTVAEALATNSRYAAYVLNNYDKNDPIYKAVEVMNNAAMRLAE